MKRTDSGCKQAGNQCKNSDPPAITFTCDPQEFVLAEDRKMWKNPGRGGERERERA